jgi:peroxiredoxin
MRWLFGMLFCLWGVVDQAPKNGLEVGDPLPAFRLESVNGEMISNDSLKGNLIVWTFWASWNQPSRKNNIEMVKLYEKYRQLNFLKKRKVLFITFSLDTQADLWKIALLKDDLHWKMNICDFKGWESPIVEQFKVSRLPTNFIAGKDGKIVAKNIWGRELDSVLTVLNH